MILNFWKYAKSQGCRYWHEPFVDILSMTFLSSYTCNASMHDIAQVIVPPPTKEKHYRRYLHCLQNDIKIMLLFLIFWFSWIRAISSNINQQILKHLLFSTSHLFDINLFSLRASRNILTIFTYFTVWWMSRQKPVLYLPILHAGIHTKLWAYVSSIQQCDVMDMKPSSLKPLSGTYGFFYAHNYEHIIK